MYEERILLLERDLEVLSIAQAQLDEQKQQNLFLKETIDRVRYEMDEMRNAAPGNIAGSGLSSAANTISKSLGAELMGKMKFDMDSDEDLEDGDTAVEDEDKTASEEEEEDVVQTIITKRKRVRIYLLFFEVPLIDASMVDYPYRKLQVGRVSLRPGVHLMSSRNTLITQLNTTLPYLRSITACRLILHPKS